MVIDDVLKRVNAPKGSFYHYFPSKDAFVSAAIDAYADYFAQKLDPHFQNTHLTPLARLDAFVEDACMGIERHHFTRGCLVGNLGQEIACLEPAMCARLQAIFRDWEHRLGECLDAAKQAGEMAADCDSAALAHAFWIGWEGAVLRARLEKSIAPLQVFLALYLQALPRKSS